MKTDIEYAALVMGFDDAELDAVTETIITVHLPGMRCFWRPLEDDGDSRRLEIACLNWLARAVPWPKAVTLAYTEYSGFVCGSIGINPDNYRAAVFALAVAIGKVIDGGGV
jgi:hypothetical protein